MKGSYTVHAQTEIKLRSFDTHEGLCHSGEVERRAKIGIKVDNFYQKMNRSPAERGKYKNIWKINKDILILIEVFVNENSPSSNW